MLKPAEVKQGPAEASSDDGGARSGNSDDVVSIGQIRDSKVGDEESIASDKNGNDEKLQPDEAN